MVTHVDLGQEFLSQNGLRSRPSTLQISREFTSRLHLSCYAVLFLPKVQTCPLCFLHV